MRHLSSFRSLKRYRFCLFALLRLFILPLLDQTMGRPAP
jgi:hypothetical protein